MFLAWGFNGNTFRARDFGRRRRLNNSPAYSGTKPYVHTLLRRPFGPMQREGAKATERGEAELLAQLLPFFQARIVTAAERKGGGPAVTPSLA